MSPGVPFFLAVLGMIVVACAAPNDRGDEATDEPTTTVSRPPFTSMPPLETEPMPSGDIGELPDDAWQTVLDDLSDRLGRAIEDPTVVAAGAVTYNDGSLGCAQPGQVYTQALVDGYRVIVEIDGREYDYRIGRQPTDIRLCESGSTLRDNPDD